MWFKTEDTCFLPKFLTVQLNVKKCPVFSPLTAHCTGLCVSVPYGDITQTGVTDMTFTHRSATELDMQGTGDVVCMPNVFLIQIFPFLCFSSHWSLLVRVCLVSPEINLGFFLVACCWSLIRGWKLLWLQWYVFYFLFFKWYSFAPNPLKKLYQKKR